MARVVPAMLLVMGAMGGPLAGQAAIDAVARVPVRVVPAQGPIEIDGVMSETAWDAAQEIRLPWEIQPGDNVSAPVETDCRITFDEHHLYFGCRAFDPDPASIRAFMTDRDDSDDQDVVGLMIDPFQDRRRSFAFAVTPLGVQEDFIFVQGADSPAWDAIWESGGRITDEGFEVEAAVPFKSLRFPDVDGIQSWNFFLWRVRPRSELVSMRSVPLDRSNQCALCQLATATGFRGISPGRNLEVSPTVTAQRVDERGSPEAPGYEIGAVEDQYGLDARWSITTDLTLNATLNPDFSQVEADAAQIQSNQQFALFFEERRPFFLEGAELFQTPERVVFTRSIADPSFGSKLSGKVGGWALGSLVARDESTHLLLPGPLGSATATVPGASTTVVARARRDIGGSHTAGVLATSREGEGYRNRVFAADARVQVAGPLTLSGQVLGSRTSYPTALAADAVQPGGTFSGVGSAGRLEFGTRNWFGLVQARAFQPGLRADAGFITSVDYRELTWRVQRKWWFDDTPSWTSVSLMGGAGQRDDWSGRPLYRFVFADINMQGALQSELVLNPDHFERSFEGRRFQISRLNVFGDVQPSGRVGIGWFLQFGEDLDYTNARESGLLRLRPWMDLRLGRAIDLQLKYDFKRLTHAGQRVFREQVLDARGYYYLSRKMFFRATVQLRDVVRDPTLYRVSVTEGRTTLATQLLFSYKLNPQSVAFVGYSDSALEERENRDPSLGLVRTQRAFFLKLSYAWRP